MIALPDDVTNWLRDVFRKCNVAASSKLCQMPNAHEPWIDFAIIEHLQRVSVPYTFKSEWIVSIDTPGLALAGFWAGDSRNSLKKEVVVLLVPLAPFFIIHT